MHGHHERLEPEQTESTRARSEYAFPKPPALGVIQGGRNHGEWPSDQAGYLMLRWSGCQDLNLRPLDPQATNMAL